MRDRIGRFQLFSALAVGLVGCQPAPRPPTTTPPVAVVRGREVSALGIASGVRNPALARQLASAHAAARLARLLEPVAIGFSYSHSGQSSRLETRVEARARGPIETSFETRAGGVVCQARGEVGQGAEARFARLRTVEGEGSARGEDLAQALALAESRALRAAIRAALALPPGASGRVEGELTLLSVEERLGDEGVRLKLRAEVVARDRRALTGKEQRGVLEGALAEHQEQKEWRPAAESLERLIAEVGTAERWALLGSLRLEATQPAAAADAYAKAFALEGKLEHLKGELEAARRIPDPARVERLQKRLDRLEAKRK